MKSLDEHFYRWITVANERRERYDLPTGHIEDAIGDLIRFFGRSWLEESLLRSQESVDIFAVKRSPLRTWLLSANIDKHVIQSLELVALLRQFAADPLLPEKINRLKQNDFWAPFFELSMAARMKLSDPSVLNCRLSSDTVKDSGDFQVEVAGLTLACECSRLTHGPETEEPHWLLDRIYEYAGEVLKRRRISRCIKLRSAEPLNGETFNRIIRLIKRAILRSTDSGSERMSDGGVSVEVEPLTSSSEPIPFKEINGEIIDVLGTDWLSANEVSYANVRDREELSDKYRHGEPFETFLYGRIFVKFPPLADTPDPYRRVAQKIRKKIVQTKSASGPVSKIIFIECPFALREANQDRLRKTVLESVQCTRHTAAVILANREGNPHYRHHYSLFTNLNMWAVQDVPALGQVLSAFQQWDSTYDLLLLRKHPRTWQDAFQRVEEHRKADPRRY